MASRTVEIEDSQGNIYVVGKATRANGQFATSDALQKEIKGDTDGFIAKLNPDGTQLLYATFLGLNDKN